MLVPNARMGLSMAMMPRRSPVLLTPAVPSSSPPACSVCVGTTSCRTIESAALDNGTVQAISGDTGIFIFPGYKFKAVDALITNFHLPESTLLMLISALYNREGIMKAYKVAVDEKYRFFSFGDAMFIQ